MKSIEEKSCYSYAPEAQNTNQPNKDGNRATHQHQRRKGLGSTTKPTPSKWDDAQKWLAGLSRGGDHSGHGKNKPRNSNAEDRRLITTAAQKGRDSCVSNDEALEESETKKIDIWQVSKPADDLLPAARSVRVRDMGTEMTPVASLEPSRTATPIRAGTPMRSPMSSRSSTPGRARPPVESYQTGVSSLEDKSEGGWVSREAKNSSARHVAEVEKNGRSLESRAMAWDEAERAKYMARYKREEVKIQAWESHRKRKAEMEMRRMEVKAERMKARAREKLANKLAATRRIAEEKRANAEAILNEQAAKTSERADYIRRTGHLPSNFSFKLPTLCW